MNTKKIQTETIKWISNLKYMFLKSNKKGYKCIAMDLNDDEDDETMVFY